MDGDRRERQAASANVAKGTTSLQIDRAPRSTSDAAVVAYMDADLRALLPLVAPLMSGHSELAIGSRLAHGARVMRDRVGS